MLLEKTFVLIISPNTKILIIQLIFRDILYIELVNFDLAIIISQ